jgi:transcriptional regulator with XRE-family HTH domain
MSKRASTVASERLRASLDPRVMSRADLAEKLGVSRQAVSDWVSGDSQPKPELMAKIEDLLGIPMRSWTETSDEADKPTGTHS